MNDKASERLILVGRILAPHGVKGWVKIEPFTESAESLRRFGGWRIGRGDPDAAWNEVKVAESVSHSGKVLARFAGCEDRDAALKYRGMGIAVARSLLPETKENEYYQADLIGLDVKNEQEVHLGQVCGLFSNGGHDVLRVRHEGGERLLPFVPAVVKSIDLESGVLRVDWQADW